MTFGKDSRVATGLGGILERYFKGKRNLEPLAVRSNGYGGEGEAGMG